MIALAPILSLKNVKGAWRSLVGPFKSFSSNDLVQRYLDSQFLKRTKATRYLAKLVKDSPELLKAWGTSIAQDFAFHSVNFNHKRYVQKRLQVFVPHTPFHLQLPERNFRASVRVGLAEPESIPWTNAHAGGGPKNRSTTTGRVRKALLFLFLRFSPRPLISSSGYRVRVKSHSLIFVRYFS